MLLGKFRRNFQIYAVSFNVDRLRWTDYPLHISFFETTCAVDSMTVVALYFSIERGERDVHAKRKGFKNLVHKPRILQEVFCCMFNAVQLNMLVNCLL